MTKQEDVEQKSFDGQRDGEELLFVFRRHIIAMRKGFYLLLGSLAVTSIPAIIWPNNIKLFLLPIGGLVLGLILFFYHFLMWRYTYYLVTSQRIRQVTQRGFFGTDVVELPLSKIQSVSYNIPGFSGEVFKFGTVIIQTFIGDMIIRLAERPNKIYNKLQDAIAQYTDKNNEEEDEEIS